MSFFFHKRGNEASNTLLKVQPPSFCPPSNGVKHTHAQCFSCQWSKSYNVWRQTQGGGGGVGWIFVLFWSIFFCLLEKKTRDIFWHKENRHAKFQWIPSNSKKSWQNRYLRLPSMEPFNYIMAVGKVCVGREAYGSHLVSWKGCEKLESTILSESFPLVSKEEVLLPVAWAKEQGATWKKFSTPKWSKLYMKL